MSTPERQKPSGVHFLHKAAIREFGALKPEDLGIVGADDPTLTVKMENNATLLLELEPIN